MRMYKRSAFYSGLSNVVAPQSLSGTVLLMHMDGTSGGNVFTDETGHVITAFGGANTSTGIKKFGTSSANFDGNADYLTVSARGDDFFRA